MAEDFVLCIPHHAAVKTHAQLRFLYQISFRQHSQPVQSSSKDTTISRGMRLTIRLLADASAAFVGSKVVQYLSEELGDGAVTSKRERNASSSDSIADRRRILLAAMTQSSAGLLSLQIQSASHYLQLGVAQAAGDHDKAAASNAAVGAALQAIVALVAWLPMKVMHESSLADACSALMHVKNLQGLVLEILLQVCAACLHASTQRRRRCLATRLHRCVLYFHLTCLDVRMLWRVPWSKNMTHCFRHTISKTL